MNYVKTQISFEAAHRLYDVETYSKECRKNVHGHSYKVIIIVGREELNKSGMVIDFKQLKEILYNNIESKYDHSCILKNNDPIADTIKNNCDKVFLVSKNPTAEWMANLFYNEIKQELFAVDSEVFVKEVQVQETENNIAIYLGDNK